MKPNWELKNCCNHDQVVFLITVSVCAVVILAVSLSLSLSLSLPISFLLLILLVQNLELRWISETPIFG